MSDKDLLQLRQVLREAVDASRMPIREMERRLGVGHGSIYRMLDGSLDLRVRHLLALAELLGVPPADFLELGCPNAARGAKRRLADWIGRASQPAPASLSLDALKDLIRETVREEMEKREAETGSPARRSRR